MIEISAITEQKRDTISKRCKSLMVIIIMIGQITLKELVPIKKPAYSTIMNGFALELKPMVFGEIG
uniref:Uncharacterized protein n=1 Tax=virus sp. ctBM815 TaxID=2825806 RepID=A0A8S5RJC8_9VIRU|nr:MAG TPA: hypothetical protein [virus sp. ctBM815]